ncbi:MAG: alpha/beta fold hydrolase [Eudoraea sp.]
MRNTKLTYLLIILFLISCKVDFKPLPKEKNTYALSTETLLTDTNYTGQIEDFYQQGEEGLLNGKSDISIYYKIFLQPEKQSPAILISSGRTEAAVKYKELIYDLYNNGYSVYIHDHRGQGLSGRMTNDPDMGYIDTFQYYVDDMKYFYDNKIKTAGHKSIYLLTHSMGGAIGMTYLEQYPEDFNAAAFSSPMLGLDTPTCGAVKLLAGEEPTYAMGEGEYYDDPQSFKNNTLTGSKIRYIRMVEAFDKEPKARLGGATYQWVLKSCDQFDYLFDNIKNIKTPFVLFSAENEQIVNKKAHQYFIEEAQELGKEYEAYLVENAQHELFIEKDEQRIEVINHILNYYSKY